MDRNTSFGIIKETFESNFDKHRFLMFVKNLVNKIDESKVFQLSGAYIPESFRGYIKSYERLGTYTDPEEKKIDILVVYLQKETSLERARTAQRNFVARYLKERDQKDAGLVAFVSPNSQDWRFSLIKMEYTFTEGKSGKVKVKEEFTPARRWSFLVGTNENSHTAKSRLAPIVQEDEHNPTLKLLEEAFNIEKVTQEFFEKYRDLFLRVKETLDDVVKKDSLIKRDFIEKSVDTVEFAKKLLGQIVFLYFLQKKGWFGVERNKDWGSGPKNFLRQLFEKQHSDYKNFFNDILEPLFYEALARERDDDFYSRFDCKIPFLNGGLFDPINNYDWVHTDILLPDDLFSNKRKTSEGDIGNGILDVFDRYNFTVKEDEPLEKEVAVDPETLGKVFENLLEVKDRKSKGTYYTPREIVHYMCAQSLICYLTTEMKDKVSKEDLEKLIKYGETVGEHDARVEEKGEETATYRYKMPESVRVNANIIDQRLAAIKVCDPAIGSGAFPVGMMTEIVRARNTLSSYLKEPGRTVYNFKRDCIQNSLYGVDVDPGAVEIAKLRLWLSLVVDEDDIKQIKPLPNLDYKIMQGNSLLEEFEGIKLFDDKLIANVNFDKEKQLQSLKDKQNNLSREYISLDQANKLTKTKKTELNEELKNINSQIKRLSQPEKLSLEDEGLFDAYNSAKKKADELKRLHKEFFETTQKKRKDELKKYMERLEWDLIEATLKEQDKNLELKKLEGFKQANIKPFFLWKLHFADVFGEKDGFDVVIANPPWGSELSSNEKLTLKERYPEIDSSTPNSFAYFIGLAAKISRGAVAFILPDSILIKDYAKTRKLIKPSLTILKWFQNIGMPEDLKPFIKVEHDVCLLIFNSHISESLFCSTKFYDSKNKLFLVKEWTANKSEMILEEFDNVYNLMLSKKDLQILEKIKRFNLISEFLQCHEGIHTGNSRDILFKNKKENKFHKPLFYGGGAGDIVDNYVAIRSGWYVDYRAQLVNKKAGNYASLRDERIFMFPKIYITRTGNPFKAFLDEDTYASNNFFSLQFSNYDQNTLESLKAVLPFIINKLTQYFIRTFAAPRLGSTFVETKIWHLLKFRIPDLSEKQKGKIVSIVDKIIEFKKKNPGTTCRFEQEINKLVYGLYELSDEEIAIIEGRNE